MADETRLEQLLEQLNEQISEFTPYKLALVDPKEIEHVKKNAYYMSKRVFDQLVDNVKRDKNLSSLPFCWKTGEGKFIALSGNHRVDAARGAGVPKILVLFTDDELTRSEQVAIQLSHNSLVGADNPSLLLELWTEITDLGYKVYSGLDDKYLETLQDANAVRLNEEPLRLQEITIYFLPPEIERFEELIKKIGPVSRKRFAAHAAEFDRFFEKLLDFKEADGVVNTGTAFLLIADIVDEWLAERQKAEIIAEKLNA